MNPYRTLTDWFRDPAYREAVATSTIAAACFLLLLAAVALAA